MTQPPLSESARSRCPSCGADAAGRFCSSCGAPLAGATCATCNTPLTAGAKYCHSCGSPVGAAAVGRAPGDDRGAGGRDLRSSSLPWVIAGIALTALIGLVAGQRMAAPAAASADSGQEALAPTDAGGGAAPVRAPDISSLSPRERADRLYDRIMRLHSEGKNDSVAFFSQMAIAAFQMLPEQDADSRYDMGRIAEVAGALPLARMQADSILAKNPTHLLGLALGMRAARELGDKTAAASYAKRLVAAAPAERAKNLPEYERHAADLDQALAEARR